MRKDKDASETLREAAANLWLKGATLQWRMASKSGQGMRTICSSLSLPLVKV